MRHSRRHPRSLEGTTLSSHPSAPNLLQSDVHRHSATHPRMKSSVSHVPETTPDSPDGGDARCLSSPRKCNTTSCMDVNSPLQSTSDQPRVDADAGDSATTPACF